MVKQKLIFKSLIFSFQKYNDYTSILKIEKTKFRYLKNTNLRYNMNAKYLLKKKTRSFMRSDVLKTIHVKITP